MWSLELSIHLYSTSKCTRIWKPKLFTAVSRSFILSRLSFSSPTACISIKGDTACFCLCLSDSTSTHWCEESDVGAARKRRLILNNIAGNTLTVFQFSFAVNNLRMWFDFHSAPSLQLEGAARQQSEGWRGRNVDVDVRCHVSVLLARHGPNTETELQMTFRDSEAWRRDAADCCCDRCVMEKHRQPMTNKTGSPLQANFAFVQHYYRFQSCSQ